MTKTSSDVRFISRTRFERTTKMLFDIVLSWLSMPFALPIIVVEWVIASIDTRSNGIFIQQRVGLYGRMFNIYKIKTMRDDLLFNTCVTTSDDPRITKSGKFLRRFKLDELPQLFNVIKGDMSLVGPRPEVSEYSESLCGEDRIILSVRPGITGPATIKYKNLEVILAEQPDPDKYSRDVIWLDKIIMNKQYVKNWSLSTDILIILITIKEGITIYLSNGAALKKGQRG